MHNTQQQLQQQWASLKGAGPRVMELKGDDMAQALGAAMDAFAQTLSAEYGVNLQELHWQKHQSISQER